MGRPTIKLNVPRRLAATKKPAKLAERIINIILGPYVTKPDIRRIVNRKGVRRSEIIKSAVEYLQSPLGLSTEGIFYPDVYLFFELLSRFATKDPLLKGGLYKAIEGKVRRPESVMLWFQPLKEPLSNSTKNQKPVTDLAKMVEKEPVFLKTAGIFAHRGRGILRMEKQGEKLIIEESEPDVLKLDIDGNTIKSITTTQVVVDLQRMPLIKVLENIAASSLHGRYIAEREIKVLPYKGHKWEIRTIVQSVDRAPRVVGSFAKIGKITNIVSNIARGGKGEKSMEIIRGLYSEMYKGEQSKITALTDEFFREANAMAVEATRALNRRLADLGRRYFGGIPKTEFYAREIAVDITAEFNPKTGKLEPIVGELQYPTFGYSPEFEQFDNSNYLKFLKNREKMTKEGKEVLRRAFGIENKIIA